MVVVVECSSATRAFVQGGLDNDIHSFTRTRSLVMDVVGTAGAMTWDLLLWSVRTGMAGRFQDIGYDDCRENAADGVFFSRAD